MAKSKLIKDKIKGLKFTQKNRDYIESLKFIERGILLNGELGWAGGWKYNLLVKHHQKEYLEILKELKPKEHEKELARIKREKIESEREEKEWKEEEQRELEAEKREWLRAEGVV